MEFHYIDGKSQIRVVYALHYDEESSKDEKISYEALNYFGKCINLIPTDDVEEDTELFVCPENKRSAYYNYINEDCLEMTIDNCYSLDRNNSFPASMVEVYPETKPYVDSYYQERLKMKQQVKDGLVSEEAYERFKIFGSIFVGWLKSPKFHRYRAWKKIISNSNKKVHELRTWIEEQGHEVLLVNTDAVKFIGKVPYQESTELGAFKYEWQDTKMYVKGVKSYAYLDGDKWKFKQAGKCLLDRVKPRDEWTLEEFKNGATDKIAVVIIDKDGHLREIYR